ncbi:MAG: flavodoxin family protein [Alphaproteobacteria bacterium]
MKLLIIKGSYHKGGFIASLIDQVAEGFCQGQSDNEVKVIDLLDAKIEFCTGCKECGRNNQNESVGSCVNKDDVSQIINDMLDADRLVLASPVYYMGTTALMKRFIERTISLSYYPNNSYPRARNKANSKKKSGVIVSTDCPYPLNKIFLLSLYPMLLLKLVAKMAGFGKSKAFAASTNQEKYFIKRAYKLGKYLAEK